MQTDNVRSSDTGTAVSNLYKRPTVFRLKLDASSKSPENEPTNLIFTTHVGTTWKLFAF